MRFEFEINVPARLESSELPYASHSLLMIASLQLQVEAPTKIQVLSSLGLDADLETRELAQLGSSDFFLTS